MSQTYFALLTAVGEAKLANSAALGTQLQISRMAVGDGNGVLPVPIRTQTALVRETYRADLNELKVDPLNASQIIAELVIPETEGGYWLREMGLYDAAGDLIAVANCPPSYKPQLAEGSGRTQIMRMVLIVSSTANIQLKIDPSVVLATREYVDITVNSALDKLDYKHSVLVATTAAITLSALQTIDGVAMSAGSRVLVKNQAAAKDNGIYVVASGAWARAADADASIEVTPGLFVHVERGTIGADSVWQLTTEAPITLGTTALVFEQIAGPSGVTAGTYRSITVDRNGRVVGGSNPTTLATAGITDAYTQAQVDAAIATAVNSLDYKHSVLVATTTAITLSALQTIDGVAMSAGSRVLVKNQAAAKDNGIYVVASGAWARAADADASIEVTPGLFVHVERGTVNADSVWQLTTDAPITLGTTALVFEQIAGATGITAGTYRSVTVDRNGRVVGGTNPTTLAEAGITDAVSVSMLEAKRSKRIARVTSATTQVLSGSSLGPDQLNALNCNFTADGGMYEIDLKVNVLIDGSGSNADNIFHVRLRNGSTDLDISTKNNDGSHSSTQYMCNWSGTLSGAVTLNAVMQKTVASGSMTFNADAQAGTNTTGQVSVIEVWRMGDAT